MKKESIFNKWGWSNRQSVCRKMNIDPYLSTCTKLKSKWIKDLSVKLDILNLLKERGCSQSTTELSKGSQMEELVKGPTQINGFAAP